MQSAIMTTQEQAEQIRKENFSVGVYEKYPRKILKLIIRAIEQDEPEIVKTVEEWFLRYRTERGQSGTVASLEFKKEAAGYEPKARPMSTGQDFGAYFRVLDSYPRLRALMLAHYRDGEPLEAVARRLKISLSEAEVLHIKAKTLLGAEIDRLDALDS